MLIGHFTGNKDIKMFFKLSYWSTLLPLDPRQVPSIGISVTDPNNI